MSSKSKLWSDASSDPIADIEAWISQIQQATGIPLTGNEQGLLYEDILRERAERIMREHPEEFRKYFEGIWREAEHEQE